MDHMKKRRTRNCPHYKKYTQETLLQAIEYVKTKKLSIKEAAEKFEIPTSTLNCKIKDSMQGKFPCNMVRKKYQKKVKINDCSNTHTRPQSKQSKFIRTPVPILPKGVCPSVPIPVSEPKESRVMIGEALKFLEKHRNFSIAIVAKKFGIPVQVLSKHAQAHMQHRPKLFESSSGLQQNQVQNRGIQRSNQMQSQYQSLEEKKLQVQRTNQSALKQRLQQICKRRSEDQSQFNQSDEGNIKIDHSQVSNSVSSSDSDSHSYGKVKVHKSKETLIVDFTESNVNDLACTKDKKDHISTSLERQKNENTRALQNTFKSREADLVIPKTKEPPLSSHFSGKSLSRVQSRKAPKEILKTLPKKTDRIFLGKGKGSLVRKAVQMKIVLGKPCKNLRKASYKNYTKEQLENAVQYVMKHHVSLSVASRRFQVPQTTMMNRLKKLGYRKSERMEYVADLETCYVTPSPQTANQFKSDFVSSSSSSSLKTQQHPQCFQEILTYTNIENGQPMEEVITIIKNEEDDTSEYVVPSTLSNNSKHSDDFVTNVTEETTTREKVISSSDIYKQGKPSADDCIPDDIAVMRNGSLGSVTETDSVTHGEVVIKQEFDEEVYGQKLDTKNNVQWTLKDHPELLYFLSVTNIYTSEKRFPTSAAKGDVAQSSVLCISCINGLQTFLPPCFVVGPKTNTNALSSVLPVGSQFIISNDGLSTMVFDKFINDHLFRYAQVGLLPRSPTILTIVYNSTQLEDVNMHQIKKSHENIFLCSLSDLNLESNIASNVSKNDQHNFEQQRLESSLLLSAYRGKQHVAVVDHLDKNKGEMKDLTELLNSLQELYHANAYHDWSNFITNILQSDMKVSDIKRKYFLSRVSLQKNVKEGIQTLKTLPATRKQFQNLWCCLQVKI